MTAREKRIARAIVKQGAHKLLANPSAVHYTQTASRWDGIAHHKLVSDPLYGGRHLLPFSGDCSSTATWLLWNALHVRFGLTDIVNGADWKAGYTGTLAQHGQRVSGRPGTRRVGDLVLYGQGPTYEHVAVVIAPDRVFSHGSEGGPYFLPIHYRPDVGEFRRYIL